jgi:DNA-binding response OmpR family regulator
MKILVIEDDNRVAELIKRGLDEQGYEVLLAYDAIYAEKILKSNSIDLIISDIVLPKMSGLDFIKGLRAHQVDIPVIMLTALGTTDDKVEGFDSGADDYMVKPFEMRELTARINALLKRNSTQSTYSTYIKYADLELDLVSKNVKRNGVEIHLTPKEFKLLEYLLKNAERVLSRAEIAENVWGTRFDTGTNFIDVYINYLRKKIDKDYMKKLIHTRSGMGFVLKEKK